MIVLAEFDCAEDIVSAAERLHELGYTRVDAYTPFPMPEIERHLGIPRSKIPFAVFAAGLTGTLTAFLLIWWTNAKSYPINVGGRPLDSFITDIPIMFETTILFAAATAYSLVLIRSGMPRLWDPSMEIEGVERTTIDRYWLLIDPRDAAYEPGVRGEMQRCGALRVEPVLPVERALRVEGAS